jgi:hypothetical protein
VCEGIRDEDEKVAQQLGTEAGVSEEYQNRIYR